MLDNGIYKTQSYFALDAQFILDPMGRAGAWRHCMGPTAARLRPATSRGMRVSRKSTSLCRISHSLRRLIFRVCSACLGRVLGSAGGHRPFTFPTVWWRRASLLSNRLTGSLSVQKEITDRAFVAWQGGVQSMIFDSRPSSGIVSVFPQSLSGWREFHHFGPARIWVSRNSLRLCRAGRLVPPLSELPERHQRLSCRQRPWVRPDRIVQGRNLWRLSKPVERQWAGWTGRKARPLAGVSTIIRPPILRSRIG